MLHFISLQLQDDKSIQAHRFALEMTSPWFKGASWLSSPLSNISINTFDAVEEVWKKIRNYFVILSLELHA